MAKRILYVVYSLNIGGLEKIVVDLANSLDPQQYEPFICCIANAGEFAEEFKYPENLFVIGNTGRINYRSCRTIHRILKEHEIHIVHSHNLAGLLYSVPAARIRHVPIIHTNHGYVEEERRNIKLKIFEKWMSRFVDRYVCVSEQLRKEVEKSLWVKRDRILVLYNGVEAVADFPIRDSLGEDTAVIGSVGRLDPIKNYRFLLEAFSEIVVRRPACRLELIGDGNEYNELVDLRNELKLNNKVVFRGNVRNPRDYVKAFDIFVLTSLSEGLSMSILEAMSLKKVCVVSHVGGNPEIIEKGMNGFLFESNNKIDFVQIMMNVIENLYTDEMKKIREAAGNTIEKRFSLDSMRGGYCKLYDAVAAK